MRTVLLAENDQFLIDILGKLLKSWGFAVTVCQTGDATLAAIQRSHPDLAIIDADLAGVNGLAICKKLKSDFLTAHIPLVLLIEKKAIRKKILQIDRGVDDYLIKPPDPIDLEVKVEMALRRHEQKFSAHPLTRLPTSMAIEYEVETRIAAGKQFSFSYCDINNFKSYNDKYGYVRGNVVIQQTAYILASVVKKFGRPDDFVGHIGGDDFVMITTPDREDVIALETIREFDRLMPLHYSKEDREKGFVTIRNRQGEVMNFPLMSISIALVNNSSRKFLSYLEIGAATAEIKGYLKSLKGSNYLSDRRVLPHQEGAVKRGTQKKAKSAAKPAKKTDAAGPMPLGQMLLQERLISEDALNEALTKHLVAGKRLGEILMEMGIVSPEQLGNNLARQFNVPYLHTKKFIPDSQLTSRIPPDVIRNLKVLPINSDENGVHIAMVNPFDAEAKNELEKILDSKITPHLILEHEFDAALEGALQGPDATPPDQTNTQNMTHTFKILKKDKAFVGKLLRLDIEDVILPNGTRARIESVRHGGAVVIIPLVDKCTIAMIKQFRPVIRKYIYEIPAGTLEKGESPVSCAKRELLEETGFVAKRIRKVAEFYAAPGYSTEKLHLFIAQDLTQVGHQTEPDEVIKTELMPLKKAFKLVFRGEIVDAKTILGILYTRFLID